MANTKAAKKFAIPRAKVRERRTPAPKIPTTAKLDKLFVKFLRRRAGRTWDHVFCSIMEFVKKLQPEQKVYVEALYDTYIELHPLLTKNGEYLRADGNEIPVGLFYVDRSGILRESEKNRWTTVA